MIDANIRSMQNSMVKGFYLDLETMFADYVSHCVVDLCIKPKSGLNSLSINHFRNMLIERCTEKLRSFEYHTERNEVMEMERIGRNVFLSYY